MKKRKISRIMILALLVTTIGFNNNKAASAEVVDHTEDYSAISIENTELSQVDVTDLTVDMLEKNNQEDTKVVGELSQNGIKPLSAGNNTNPNNAEEISVNNLYFDAITEEGQERWYLFYSNQGKLTVDLWAPNSTDVDYDVTLYKYNNVDYTITPVGGSYFSGTASEHFAMPVDAGVYFLAVEGYEGYDAANEYQL